MYSPPPDPDTEQRMRAHHARAANALDAQRAFSDLNGHRPALLGVYDTTAYRA
ncbi:hypothetical protein [Streptomyces sp. Tue6028]|uniref:hypothetical protein n=1 Tax=Streptomyces sp. Tue6028 TaxID=2036037 RepID=UPI003EBCA783